MYQNYLKSIALLLLFFTLLPTPIYADFALGGSNTLTGSPNIAMPITDLQITGTGTEPIPVKLLVTSGTLSMSTTTGLTFDGATSGSTIYFSGTQANINTALATLTYTRATTGTDTLEVSLVPRGEVFFTDNNHLYKFITGAITADNARTAAAAQTAYDATGYLATITSEEENDFVADRLQGDGWMGAGDNAGEGDWKWLVGPEAGTSFWSGASGGNTVGGNYANWAPGEPNDYNNGSPGEDCAQFYISTGMWNDLPCSGSNLNGYVVEFGAPGDLPQVIAKNISISTVQNPTVTSLSPTDGATGTSLNANLIIQFTESVSADTGNILIKKTSDDTTAETIDVTSDQITGEGTTTITINPTTTFTDSTGYYITIPGTAFEDTDGNHYAGISDSTTWNFTTGDFTNPIDSDITATSLTNSAATITWTTNENTSSRVRYGLTTAYGTNTSETDTTPRVTSHSVALSSLLTCTTYHYVVVSVDSSTNTTTSSDQIFTTTGCNANATPTDTTSTSITSATGGTTNLTESDSEITVITPANFTDDASTVVIQIQALPNASILNSVGRPSQLPQEIGDIIFDVKAIINGTTILDSFDAPITITYVYADADLTGLDEASLWLYHYHTGAWHALDSCTNNTSTNTISCTTPNFSIFGLFGKSQVIHAQESNAPSIPTCQALPPTGDTDLFQIDVNHTKATLYYTPLNHHVTTYYISYGYTPGEERFGTFTGQGTSNGILSFTINELTPHLTYYFKLRPFNDCMPGPWSNEIKITTVKTKTTSLRYYKNYLTKMLAQLPKSTSPVNTAANACEYTVQPGDSLWKIAKNQLGSGSKYTQIMNQNNLTTQKLSIGTSLKINCH